MILLTMNDEELKKNAFRDFLEMRTKIEVLFDHFRKDLKLFECQKRMVHSLVRNHTIRTRALNVWHVHFSCGGCDSKGRALLSQVIYMPLQREDRVDYLFINNMDYFILERVTAHFLQRYKERYIDYNNINLQGVHPALYFFFNNSNRQMINYQPDSWTDEDLKEKRIYISNQGLLVTKAINDIVVYITFLDHDNLSRYKAEIFEEEQAFLTFNSLCDIKECRKRRSLLHKLLSDPAYVNLLKRRYYRKELSPEADTLKKDFDEMLRQFKEFIDRDQELSKPFQDDFVKWRSTTDSINSKSGFDFSNLIY